MLYVLGPGQVGDMNQAVDSIFNFEEGAKVGQLAHPSLDHRTDRISLAHRGPGVRLELFDAQRDAAVADLHFQYHRFHLIAGLDHFARMLPPGAPGHFRDVNQTLHARLDLDKRAVICDTHHPADNAAPSWAPDGQRFPRVRRQLPDAERNALLLTIELKNLNSNLVADVNYFGWWVD